MSAFLVSVSLPQDEAAVRIMVDFNQEIMNLT